MQITNLPNKIPACENKGIQFDMKTLTKPLKNNELFYSIHDEFKIFCPWNKNCFLFISSNYTFKILCNAWLSALFDLNQIHVLIE